MACEWTEEHVDFIFTDLCDFTSITFFIKMRTYSTVQYSWWKNNRKLITHFLQLWWHLSFFVLNSMRIKSHEAHVPFLRFMIYFCIHWRKLHPAYCNLTRNHFYSIFADREVVCCVFNHLNPLSYSLQYLRKFKSEYCGGNLKSNEWNSVVLVFASAKIRTFFFNTEKWESFMF